MATIFNDWEYQMRLARLASGDSHMVWFDAYGYVEMPIWKVEAPPQVYTMHNAASVSFNPMNMTICSYYHNYSSYNSGAYDAGAYFTTVKASEFMYGGSLEDIRVVDVVKEKCSDCKGSGIYFGLTSRESCKRCGGTGDV